MTLMRLVCAAIILAVLRVPAAAQSSPASRETFVPSIGLPLPPIGLPLPPMGLPPVSDPRERRTDSSRSDVSERRQRRSDVRRHFWPVPPFTYVVPSYGWDPFHPTPPLRAYSQEDEFYPSVGALRLEIEAEGDPQVYVDSVYAGTLDDLQGGLHLDAGVHQIEVREAGFEPLAVAVNIIPNRTITFRGTLKPDGPQSAQKPAQSVRPPASSTFYLIPGCYLGNVAPTQAVLPPGCDLNQLVTYRPQEATP